MAQREKLVSLQEAAAAINSGDFLLASGEMDALPMALIRELVRAGKRGFKVMGLPGNGLAWDFLMGAGAVGQAEICHMSLADYGPAPNFKRLCQDGRLKVIENTCGIALSMAQAAAVGSPFLAVRGLYGTDVMALRDDFKAIDDPYHPGEQIVVAPALRPDVFITHGLMADRQGNVITVDGGRNDFLAAQAAKSTIVTVEQISEEPLTTTTKPGWIFIPAFYVDAVALTPRGSHPVEFPGLYPADEAHLRTYINASKSDASFQAYLEQYVLGGTEDDHYQARVNLATAASSR